MRVDDGAQLRAALDQEIAKNARVCAADDPASSMTCDDRRQPRTARAGRAGERHPVDVLSDLREDAHKSGDIPRR